jgi:hypothetical protein
MVPEGVEGLVEYKGSLEKVINVLVGALPQNIRTLPINYYYLFHSSDLRYTSHMNRIALLFTHRYRAGGVQAGLAHSGAADIVAFQRQASLWTQSFAGVAEGNPHDLTDVRH